MIKHSQEELLKFFEEYNMNCSGLAQLLDIPYSTVKRYLIDGKEICREKMVEIDMAIRVIRKIGHKRPEWIHATSSEKFSYQNDAEKFRKEIREGLQEERDTLSPFVDELMLILGYEPKEFGSCPDAIDKVAGLETYGLEEGLRRRARVISQMLM